MIVDSYRQNPAVNIHDVSSGRRGGSGAPGVTGGLGLVWWEVLVGLGMGLAAVEDAQAQRGGDAGDDPEGCAVRGLGPAPQLEVMLQGGHPEPPFAAHLDRAALDDDRERDD